MSRPVLDALGGLLEGLLSLPSRLFGGGPGGLLDGLIGGGKGTRATQRPRWDPEAFTSFPPPASQGQRTQKQAPSTRKKTKQTMAEVFG